MSRANLCLIVALVVLLQIFIFFIARREISHSEIFIYAFFFSISVTSICSYAALKANYEKEDFKNVLASAIKPSIIGAASSGIFAAICATSFFLYSDIVTNLSIFNVVVLIKIFILAIPAVIEEIIFRGILLKVFCRTLQRFGITSVIVGNIIQAFVFALTHGNTMQFQEYLYPLSVFIFGMVLGYWAIKQKSLWFSMGFHVGWDFANGIFFGIHKKILTNEPGLFVGFLYDAKFIEISLIVFAIILGFFYSLSFLKKVQHRKSRDC